MQIFYNPAEFAIPTRITTNETKIEIETHPVAVEIKHSNCSVLFKAIQTFLWFLLIKSSSFIYSNR